MSLELYPSAEQAMLLSEGSYLVSQKEALKRIELALQSFADDTSLSGKAYASAKELFARTLIPAVRGIASLCTATESANGQVARYLGQYSWAASDHISESKLSTELEDLRNKRSQLLQLNDEFAAFESYCYSLNNLIDKLEDRISQMHKYNNETSSVYGDGESLSDLLSGIKGALDVACTITFDPTSGSFAAVGADWSFESKLKDVPSLIEEKERLALEFYQSLPPNLRVSLSVNDFEATADGFVLCTKSMDEILGAMGHTLSEEDVSYFQGYHLFGLRDPEGGFEYSMFNVVLPGQSEGHSGISVPFRSLDITVFGGPSRERLTNLRTTIIKVFDSDTIDNPSSLLINYFKDPKSEASYLIADFTIAKALAAAGITGEGQWSPGTIDTIMDSDKYTAEALQRFERLGIVDIENGTVNFKDAQRLSRDEKSAILACITSNPDLYSYAAENQFHADIFGQLGFLGPVGRRAIISDAGVGESVNDYEFLFKEKDDATIKMLQNLATPPQPFYETPDVQSYYTQQVNAHGIRYKGGV